MAVLNRVLVQEGLTIEEMHLMSGHSRVTLFGADLSVDAHDSIGPAVPEGAAKPTPIQVIPYLKTSYAVSPEIGRFTGFSAPYGISETAEAFCRLILLKMRQPVGAKTQSPDSMYYPEVGFGRRRIFLRLDCKGCINRLDMLEYKRSCEGMIPACDVRIERTA